MLDGTPAAGPQPTARQFDDRVDDSHPVRATEQCMRWIMLCHFGFQCHPVGDVGRVGDQEVDLSVQGGQQRGVGDVGVQEFDGGASDVSAGVSQRVIGIVDGDDAGIQPELRQGQSQCGRARAQVDDQRARW